MASHGRRAQLIATVAGSARSTERAANKPGSSRIAKGASPRSMPKGKPEPRIPLPGDDELIPASVDNA